MARVELSLVIPAYDEEASIPHLYGELKDVLKKMGVPYEVIFVDDGSSDNTFEILKEIHSKVKNMKIIKLKRHFGQSGALQAGFDSAKGNYVVSMDSDLQNDPKDVRFLLKEIKRGGYDIVCGWRFKRQDPFLKKLFSKIANWLRRKLTGEEIHDAGCTMRIYKKNCLKDVEIYGELHRYISALLFWKGYKIGEVKVKHRKRKFGKTKYDWERIVKGFLDLLFILFWHKYSLRLSHIFGGLGLALGFTGLILSAYLCILKLLFGIGLLKSTIFLIAMLFVLTGLQLFAFAVLADIMIRTYYSKSERKRYSIEKILK